MSTLIAQAAEMAKSDFTALPIIDMTDARSPDLEKRKAVAANIRKACLKEGFFYVKNHVVPPSVVAKTFEVSKDFFEQPEDVKSAVDIGRSDNFRGYMAILTENNNPDNKGEMHEAFNLGLDPILAPEAFAEQEALKAKGISDGLEHSENLWPAPETYPAAVEFKQAVLNYYSAVLALGQSLFPLFALALDMPENYFDDKIRHPAAIMRLLHYPAQGDKVVDEKTPGIGAHTDFECFTILCQGDVPGLQVQNKKGDWIEATCIPDTFVINIGDEFARWTNDIFVSTRHRALTATTRPRYSIPFFFGCDHDVILTPPPTCVAEDRPWRYEPIKAGAYVKSRLDEVYTVVKATA